MAPTVPGQGPGCIAGFESGTLRGSTEPSWAFNWDKGGSFGGIQGLRSFYGVTVVH